MTLLAFLLGCFVGAAYTFAFALAAVSKQADARIAAMPRPAPTPDAPDPQVIGSIGTERAEYQSQLAAMRAVHDGEYGGSW